jgi:HD superfamily phosphohydrolase
MKFTDIIYGSIELPDWLMPFLKIPEFVRLRGVRLSNVDSFEFKDFNGPTRWEHCIGVAYLAMKYATKRRLSDTDAVHLILAALLHDVATPPFAHTVEYVLEGYDHEFESYQLLSANSSDNSNPSLPVFASQTPKFRETCKKAFEQFGIKINPDIVAEMVNGEGEMGYLINGTIDLDNIDNVTRASLSLAINIDRNVPLAIIDWLASTDGIPLDLSLESNSSVQAWLNYKNEMYSKFFNSSDEELGRQAFLQHLIRRVHRSGLSRRAIIWNTDDLLLTKMEEYEEKYESLNEPMIINQSTSLRELVQRYRLLETPIKLFEIPLENVDEFKLAKRPAFANWLEEVLTTPTFEVFVIVNSKRYSKQNTLFNENIGIIQVYKLGNKEVKNGQLPEFLNIRRLNTNTKVDILEANNTLIQKVRESFKKKPWLELTTTRKDNLKANLDSIGNWSFRQSRNEGLHSYPGTFVHAIPASLITALGLQGETIWDPFGGTAQTALEAVKLGCKVVTSDSNSIASLVAKVKLTYLNKKEREAALSITEHQLKTTIQTEETKFDNILKWHHPETITELSNIKSFINLENNITLKDLYKVCFSDILTSCTARKGKQHGYFADNTPLAKGILAPDYENAYKLFLSKIKRNISVLEKSYLFFEKRNLSTVEELSNATVIQNDITKGIPTEFIAENTVAAIITSPPYLCMADYTLGQRLSYYWLFEESFNDDFKNEIGSRRSRIKKEKAMLHYLEDMRAFAKNSFKSLRDNGFLATVIGAPVALQYKEKNMLTILDEMFIDEGFEIFWQAFRPINWHRNHGYARLKEERIVIYIKKKTN